MKNTNAKMPSFMVVAVLSITLTNKNNEIVTQVEKLTWFGPGRHLCYSDHTLSHYLLKYFSIRRQKYF